MPEAPAPHDEVDHERLAALLGALAYPLRLELLEILRWPHALAEIVVAPRRPEAGALPDRPAAKQTVHAHLERLREVGLVRLESEGVRVPRYVVNPARLYTLVEELRQLSLLHAGHGLPADATDTLAAGDAPAQPQGARLVLVHGVYDGKVWPLPEREALIGRSADCDIALDYDQSASARHAAIARSGGRCALRDLETSKNGTSVNWRQLPRGASHLLRAGDVIGIGRSRLLFLEG